MGYWKHPWGEVYKRVRAAANWKQVLMHPYSTNKFCVYKMHILNHHWLCPEAYTMHHGFEALQNHWEHSTVVTLSNLQSSCIAPQRCWTWTVCHFRDKTYTDSGTVKNICDPVWKRRERSCMPWTTITPNLSVYISLEDIVSVCHIYVINKCKHHSILCTNSGHTWRLLHIYRNVKQFTYTAPSA